MTSNVIQTPSLKLHRCRWMRSLRAYIFIFSLFWRSTFAFLYHFIIILPYRIFRIIKNILYYKEESKSRSINSFCWIRRYIYQPQLVQRSHDCLYYSRVSRLQINLFGNRKIFEAFLSIFHRFIRSFFLFFFIISCSVKIEIFDFPESMLLVQRIRNELVITYFYENSKNKFVLLIVINLYKRPHDNKHLPINL